MDTDTELKQYYAAFDSAVSTLPADYRKHACLETSGVTAKGIVEIRDKGCNLIAEVQDTTRPYLVQPPATPAPAKPEPAMASKAYVEHILRKSIEIVARETFGSIKTLKETIAAQANRIAELEAETVNKSLGQGVELRKRLDETDQRVKVMASQLDVRNRLKETELKMESMHADLEVTKRLSETDQRISRMGKQLDVSKRLDDIDAQLNELRSELDAKAKSLQERAKGLEAKTRALEEKASVSIYAGLWQPNVTYATNQMVSWDFALWICRQETNARPDESRCWSLALDGTGKHAGFDDHAGDGSGKGKGLQGFEPLKDAVQLNERVNALEQNLAVKSREANVVEDLARRLDQIEATVQTVAERAVHYRGFWRSGTQAKRNESYTDGGSLWIAINTTTDRPSENSEDWRIAARKGRDAR